MSLWRTPETPYALYPYRPSPASLYLMESRLLATQNLGDGDVTHSDLGSAHCAHGRLGSSAPKVQGLSVGSWPASRAGLQGVEGGQEEAHARRRELSTQNGFPYHTPRAWQPQPAHRLTASAKHGPGAGSASRT